MPQAPALQDDFKARWAPSPRLVRDLGFVLLLVVVLAGPRYWRFGAFGFYEDNLPFAPPALSARGRAARRAGLRPLFRRHNPGLSDALPGTATVDHDRPACVQRLPFGLAGPGLSAPRATAFLLRDAVLAPGRGAPCRLGLHAPRGSRGASASGDPPCAARRRGVAPVGDRRGARGWSIPPRRRAARRPACA